MKQSVPRCIAVLLIAASMIGCGDTESNLPGGGEGGTQASGAGAERTAQRGAVEPGADDAGGGAAARSTGGDETPRRTGGEAVRSEPGTVLFIGTSLTAGLGVPQSQSFPLLIERRIEEAGLPFRVVNAGVSGETSAGALRRIDWLLRQDFDVVVVETGANDMLRGIDPQATERNIQAIIDRLREGSPDAVIVLAGMLALPNLGEAYGREFEAIYPRLAERNDVAFVPFLLEGVGGERALNQDDGVHPNEEGHEVIAETVWDVLEPVLVEAAEAESIATARARVGTR